MLRREFLCVVTSVLTALLGGCSSRGRDYPLNAEVAHTALNKALQQWVDGAQPADLKPEIIVGDPAWLSGRKLAAFDIVTAEEYSDGSNLHIPVDRTFRSEDGRESKSRVVYIVATSPVITIFPE